MSGYKCPANAWARKRAAPCTAASIVTALQYGMQSAPWEAGGYLHTSCANLLCSCVWFGLSFWLSRFLDSAPTPLASCVRQVGYYQWSKPKGMSSVMRLSARVAGARTGSVAVLRSRAALPQVMHQKQQRSFSSAAYVDKMRAAWQNDPSSVHESWNSYFAKEPAPASTSSSDAVTSPELQEVASDHIKMLLLVRSFLLLVWF